MILIFGGAYQGKLDYALTNYGLHGEDVYPCADCGLDFAADKKIITGLELYLLELVKAGRDPIATIKSCYGELSDKIVICTDISCGVVPTDPLLRAWREAVGRVLAYLSREAEVVVRLFCGIGQRIK